MEADFLREYAVHLDRDLPNISWRKFMVLIRCLSPNAATVTLLRPKEFIGGTKSEKTVTVVGKDNVDKSFTSLFAKKGGRRKRGSRKSTA